MTLRERKHPPGLAIRGPKTQSSLAWKNEPISTEFMCQSAARTPERGKPNFIVKSQKIWR
jgi:hypothetical protein